MQEYTSLETSKQLYEMFGWSDTSGYYYYKSDGVYGSQIARTLETKPGWWRISGEPANDTVPMYSLPYLLDKLPVGLENGEYLQITPAPDDQWEFGYAEYGEIPYGNPQAVAATPVEAAALLCLELGKRGILPKVNKTPDNVAISDGEVNKIASKQIMYCVVGEEGIEFTSESEQEAKQFIADEVAGVGHGGEPADEDYYYITTMTKAELDALPEV